MLFVVLAPPEFALGQPVLFCRRTPRGSGALHRERGAYNAGRFDEAVRLLERAYGLHQESTLLYNLARAHEGAGNDLAARDAYERYLVSNPDTADLGAIEGRIAALEAAITREAALREGRERAQAEAELARAEADHAQAEAERRRAPAVLREPSPWPWTLGGAGLAAGGIMGGLTLNDLNVSLAGLDRGGFSQAYLEFWMRVDITSSMPSPYSTVSIRLGSSSDPSYDFEGSRSTASSTAPRRSPTSERAATWSTLHLDEIRIRWP